MNRFISLFSSFNKIEKRKLPASIINTVEARLLNKKLMLTKEAISFILYIYPDGYCGGYRETFYFILHKEELNAIKNV